mmetsp:Transcript_18734/g.61262  ORF Transcript_18734/g.61262 Transcript_18734/m.61262 type:complete len:237 (+) Transcript_18734:1432-2142(+)
MAAVCLRRATVASRWALSGICPASSSSSACLCCSINNGQNAGEWPSAPMSPAASSARADSSTRPARISAVTTATEPPGGGRRPSSASLRCSCRARSSSAASAAAGGSPCRCWGSGEAVKHRSIASDTCHGIDVPRSAASDVAAHTYFAVSSAGALARTHASIMRTYEVKVWPSISDGTPASCSAMCDRSPLAIASSHSAASEVLDSSSSFEAARIDSKAASARSNWLDCAHTPSMR